MKKSFLLALLLGGGFPATAHAQWRLEAWFGDAYNAHSPVTFHQTGEPDIRISPVWTTRPFAPTWYYSGRVAKWDGASAWAFEYMHHKIYLENPSPPDVSVFRITNGINNLLGERLWRVHGFEMGVGAGPVLAVPISLVRGQKYGGAHGIFNSRYELSGATLQVNLARRIKLIPYTSGTFSIKGTATKLRVTIADGNADLMNYAVHLQYGISLEAKR